MLVPALWLVFNCWSSWMTWRGAETDYLFGDWNTDCDGAFLVDEAGFAVVLAIFVLPLAFLVAAVGAFINRRELEVVSVFAVGALIFLIGSLLSYSTHELWNQKWMDNCMTGAFENSRRSQ